MADETKPADEPPAEAPKYDQEFFLALAAKGKDAWNAWRRDPANKYVRVTFKGVDFSEAPRDQINFAGFEFGDGVDFSRCKWRGGEWPEILDDPNAFKPGRACFTGAAFGDRARFDGAAFRDEASFDGASIGAWATFTGAAFGSGTSFDGAAFGDEASLNGASFGAWATFTGAAFGREASLNGVAFGGLASFEGAAFGSGTSFDGAAFGEGVRFAGAAFGDYARFDGAAFGDNVRFDGAAFGDNARFDGAAFGNNARFDGAAFGEQASFDGAAFGKSARFDGANFGDLARFAGATFGDWAFFDGATFGDWARFDSARFNGRVLFTGKTIEHRSKDFDPKPDEADEVKQARSALKKRHEDSWTKCGAVPDRFLKVSFARARFDGRADFSERSFSTDADFTNARFYSPPDFDAAASAARIDFTGVSIGFVPACRLLHLTSRSDVPVRLRRLRKLAEDTKNHDLERDLYIEERKAERGVYLIQRWEAPKEDGPKNWPSNAARLVAHVLWIGVMGIYWALADYGRSFVRPAVALALSWYGSYWLYRWDLSSIMATAPDIDRYRQAVWMLALGNTVPFVGPLTIDSEINRLLFCPNNSASCLPPIPPEGYQLLVLSQNLLSIILVFFIGLALRNYFRIK